MRNRIQILALAVVFLSLASCGGGGTTNPPAAVSVLVSPSSPSIMAGATQQFTATVSNTTNKSVTWSLSGPGTISTSGLYTAPASLTTPATATVKATSQADQTKSNSVIITIPAVATAVLPSTPSVVLGATRQFTATVSNATDTTVSWSIAGPGSVSAGGLYTAPAVLTTPDTATITATPTADPTKAASTTVTIPQVTLAVSPAIAILNAYNAQSFAAVVGNATDTSVTWSVTGGGTIDSAGTYTAPSTVTTTSNVTATAISVADPAKAATATVTLSPFTVDVSGYVITSDFQYQTLTVDAIDSATGRLRPNGQQFISSDPSAAPYRTIVHPSGKFVYADWIFTGIQGYSISADGSLTLIPGSPFAVPNSRPSAMTITPDGKYFYLLDWALGGPLWAFSINPSTGALTPLSGYSPWIAGFNGESLVAHPSSKFLYAFNAGLLGGYCPTNGFIEVFAIDSATGGLSHLQEATAPQVSCAKKMVIDPSGRFLYATTFYGGKVVGFMIDPTTGLLTLMPGAPYAGDISGASNAVAVDPQGKYVYVAGISGILMYTIDNTSGALTQLPFVYPREAGDLETDPTGNFLYANFLFNMTALAVDRTNNQLTYLNSIHSRTLTGASRSLYFSVAPAAAAVSYKPVSTYVLNSGDNTVSAYTIDKNSGLLTPAGAAVSTGGTNPSAMAADLHGKYLFVVNKDSDNISVFSVNAATGALTMTAGSPYAAGLGPTGVAVDPSGRFVYITNSGDGSVVVYSLDDESGELLFAANIASSGLCSGTRSLTIEPRGLYLFETCTASDKVLSRYIAPNTGLPGNPDQYSPGGLSLAVSPYGAAPPYSSLVEWHSFAFLVNPIDQLIKRFIIGNVGELVSPVSGPVYVNQGLAVDPFDRYLYAADSNANNVQACAIDQSEGTLTLVSGSPWTAGTAPTGAAVDITGRFLYVVNRNSSTVSGFYINRPTGVLTPMSPPTFATGNMPIAILTTGTIK